MEGLTPGRIVHFFHPKLDGPRAALVVRVWGDGGGPGGTCNLTVFTDWQNDRALEGYNGFDGRGSTVWATSVQHLSANPDPTQATVYWDWPARS